MRSGISVLCCAVALSSTSGAVAELPQSPSIRALCKDAVVVLSGEPVQRSTRYKPESEAEFEFVTFKVFRIYKGKQRLESSASEADGGVQEADRLVTVIMQTEGVGCHVPPKYKEQRRYLLFLSRPIADNLHARCPLDRVWGEREWTESLEKKVFTALADQARMRPLTTQPATRPGGDSGIPQDAEARTLPLYPGDKRSGVTRRVGYWLQGEKIGERGWSSSGQLRYEEAMTSGVRHGRSRAYYDDGHLWQERFYVDDMMHGPCTQWEKDGTSTVSYWLDGTNVAKEAYLQVQTVDPILPWMRP